MAAAAVNANARAAMAAVAAVVEASIEETATEAVILYKTIQ